MSGEAVIRKGLRGSSLIVVLVGYFMLGFYGVVVNIVKWDFSKLLGVYVAVFAVISILFSKYVFNEKISNTILIGLVLIIRLKSKLNSRRKRIYRRKTT